MAVDMRKLLESVGCVKSETGAWERDGLQVLGSAGIHWAIARIAVPGGSVWVTDRRTVQATLRDVQLSCEAAKRVAAGLTLAADIADAYNRERGD